MNWANINWETVLVTAIPAILLLAGVIFNGFRTKKNEKAAAENTITVKREPTWVELEESNRSLRKEMKEQGEGHDKKIKELEDRFDTFEKKTNVRIAALSNMLHAASRQWPAETPGPYFDSSDLEALEHTDVPYVWRNRARPAR